MKFLLEKFGKEYREAVIRVASFDAIDGHEDLHPATIKQALIAGILNPESGAQFDAVVMLNRIEMIMREKEAGK